AHVMFDSGKAGANGLLDQIRVDDRATLGKKPVAGKDRTSARPVADDEAAETEVAHQDVRAHTEQEMRRLVLAGDAQCVLQLVRRGGFEIVVRGTADLERRVRSQNFLLANALFSEGRSKRAKGGTIYRVGTTV